MGRNSAAMESFSLKAAGAVKLSVYETPITK